MGQVYLQDQQNEKAAAVTAAALARDPRNSRLRERLVAIKIALGDRIAARRLCEEWMKQEPKASAPYWLMGRACLGDLRYEEGARWLEEAVRRSPTNVEYLGFLGAALQRIPRRDSRERSVEILARAMALNPDHGEYRELLAHSLRQLGETDLAYRQFLRALDADPKRLPCYNAAAQLAWQMRDPGAGALFARLLQGVQQQTREESQRLRQVVDHPDNAEARLALGRYFMSSGRLRQAEVQVQRAAELRPDMAGAKSTLAQLRRLRSVL
jgi:tetratricopeptide (TPR) repeat protein